MIVLAYNLTDMTSVDDGRENIEHEIITEILKICTDGCTEQTIMEHTELSHDQLITWGGPIATFRWDNATHVDFKNFSVREIEPPAAP